jgi:polyhydroxybutyrate depolymerase
MSKKLQGVKSKASTRPLVLPEKPGFSLRSPNDLLREKLRERLWKWERKCIQTRSSSAETHGIHFFPIKHGLQTREYYVYVPPSYDEKKPTPVVLNFHGGGGSAEGHMRMTMMNEKSDSAGFIVVYPRGTGKDSLAIFNRFWNFASGPNGLYHDDPFFAKVDDVGFVNLLLDDLEAKFNVEKKEVYATGFSNGGILCHFLACKLSVRIAAIAPVAGSFWMHPDSCNPTRPVPVLYFHGTGDVCAPYNGGLSACEAGISKTGRVFISVKDTVSIWIKKNQCPFEPEITYQQGEVVCKTYGSGSNNSEVTVCTIEDGGHTWPGGLPYRIPGFKVGKVTYDINANDAMWEFFKRHPMSKE